MAKKLWIITVNHNDGNLKKGMSVEIMSQTKPSLSEIREAIERKYNVKLSSSLNSSYLDWN